LGNLDGDADVDISSAWESVRCSMKASATDSLRLLWIKTAQTMVWWRI